MIKDLNGVYKVNVDYLIRLEPEHKLLTDYGLFEFLGSKYEKVIFKLLVNKGQNLVIKPFHHKTIVFVYR